MAEHTENIPSGGWKQGPPPPNTWNWGGVVLHPVGKTGGFFFADFCGNYVKVFDGTDPIKGRRVEPYDVAWYNNCLDLPPIRPNVRDGG
jgi:hypothetical protein